MGEVKNFAWPVTAVSKEDYSLITAFFENNRELFAEKKALIFGAGIRGAIMAMLAVELGYEEILFSDNNPDKWGGVIDGFFIISPEEAFARRDEFVFIISAEEGNAIRKQLMDAGLIENEEFFYLRTNLYEKYTIEYKREMHDEVLVLGDCMFEVISFEDENKDSLAELLQKKFGKENIKHLTMHGMSMPSFFHAVKGQINSGFVPKTIVVMINFETLTGKQHLLPRSQHSELAKMISETSPDPDGMLKAYAELTAERVKNIQADFFTTDKLSANRVSSNDKGKISDNASRMFFKMNYLYKLNTEMESLQYLRKLYDLAEEYHIRMIPFVPPVNYQRGEELFGEDFEKKYQANLEALTDVIREKGGNLLDLSHICTRDMFAHVTTPDETTNYRGRCLVAERIAETVTGGC